MISLVSLLSLQAHGANFTVNGANTLQAALDLACTTTLPGPHTINIDNSGATAELTLGPGSLEGDVVTYPSGVCTGAPDITIQPTAGVVTIGYATQATEDATLFNFIPRNNVAPNVTLRDLRLIGSLAVDVPGDVGRANSLDCAAGGDSVRGVRIAGGTGTPGSLTIDNTYFHCLDGDHLQAANGRAGGAIWSLGAPVTVTNSVFDANYAFEGGAIAVDPGNTTFAPSTPSLVIDGSTFVVNAGQIGGAVSVRKPGNAVTVLDSVFEANVGFVAAGGVNLVDVGEVTIQRTVFDRQNPTLYNEEGGLSVQTGGSVRVDGGDGLLFRNNLVCGSWGVEGGGVWAVDPGDVDIEGSVFSENGAYCYGGGLYIEGGNGEEVRVVNNTFAANEAGRPPPQSNLEDCAIGGGGAAGFEGVNPEFRNNVVAFQRFGGGVYGHYIPFTADPGYQIGDELVFYNNLWFDNVDNVGAGNITGDFASIAFHPSNLFEDPLIVYLGDGEFNCRPDAFYPRRESPAVNAGGGEVTGGVPGGCQDYVDTDSVADFDQDSPLANDPSCDIGAFGGRYGLFAKDTDLDGFSNIFDCNDDDAGVNPGAVDICDFVDNNCNGVVDENDVNTFWEDNDGDGFGDPFIPQVFSCEGSVPGMVSNDDDCDDLVATIYTGASEICNGIDDNCDDVIDDGLTYSNYYNDFDGDGYGANGSGTLACSPPVGIVTTTQSGDCDDSDALRNPQTPEVCGDGIDNNCNGELDPFDPQSVGALTLFVDNDGDGAGDDLLPTQRICGSDPSEGYASAGGDCNDAASTVGPAVLGFQEQCSTPEDDDCDGTINEADSNTGDALIVFLDQDADGFGSDLQKAYLCEGDDVPTGYVAAGGDCNDGDALVGECSECGCQATPSPLQGGLGLLVGIAGLLLRRRR